VFTAGLAEQAFGTDSAKEIAEAAPFVALVVRFASPTDVTTRALVATAARVVNAEPVVQTITFVDAGLLELSTRAVAHEVVVGDGTEAVLALVLAVAAGTSGAGFTAPIAARIRGYAIAVRAVCRVDAGGADRARAAVAHGARIGPQAHAVTAILILGTRSRIEATEHVSEIAFAGLFTVDLCDAAEVRVAAQHALGKGIAVANHRLARGRAIAPCKFQPERAAKYVVARGHRDSAIAVSVAIPISVPIAVSVAIPVTAARVASAVDRVGIEGAVAARSTGDIQTAKSKSERQRSVQSPQVSPHPRKVALGVSSSFRGRVLSVGWCAPVSEPDLRFSDMTDSGSR
jgi:hypothetical protein